MISNTYKIEQILTLLMLYLESGKTNESLRLLERVKSRFTQEHEENLWALCHAEALIAHGQPDRALEEAKSQPDPHVSRRIRTMALRAIGQRSGTWQPLAEHLEACFTETQDGTLLFELCQLKAQLEEWHDVADRTNTLMQMVGTADALRLAAYASWHAERPQQCLQLLQEHGHLFPDKTLPDDLRRMYDLPVRHLHGLWPLLLQARTCD